MADLADVRRIAIDLPDSNYDEDSATCQVEGTQYAWQWRERVHPKKTKVPRPDVLVIRVDGEDDKQALIAANPDTLFTEPHYDGYPMVLVRVPEIGVAQLTELLDDSRRLTQERARARPARRRAAGSRRRSGS
jgi:hypothetical protein